MARRKSKRKAEFLEFPNCFKEATEMAGKWREFFGNDGELWLETGCGKGEMSRGLAKLFPEKNFMGIDMKSDRMWKGATLAKEDGLENIAFHRMEIANIADYFAPAEVDGMWITFPDPQPKKRTTSRRLTHEKFLKEYAKILRPGAVIHFKTDNRGLFDWTLKHFEEIGLQAEKVTFDLHGEGRDILKDEIRGIITFYEQRFIDAGKKIKYCRFSLDGLQPSDSAGEVRTAEKLDLREDEEFVV